MVSNLEELEALLENSNITLADIEYIVKFMQNENISPQLAMRRIKAFDTLKDKLESNDGKEKVALLEEELKQIKNQLVEKNELLQSLQQEKSGLESQKLELESKSELIDSERDELQRQLEMIKEMQFTDDEPNDDNNEQISNLEEKLARLIIENKQLGEIIEPIKNSISQILAGENFEFDDKKILARFNGIASSSIKKSTSSDQMTTIQPDKPKPEPTGISAKEPEKEKLKEEKPKKDEKKEPEKKISEKEEQVLNLFLEFISEAESDAGFKERVATICDMDEAYQYLGSIGLSQMYSFSSRGIEKKEELIELLKSWKKEGIPR